jgi:hypothetical protein
MDTINIINNKNIYWFENIIKKAILLNYKVFSSQQQNASKTWFVDYNLYVKDGFYNYETLVSYNNMMGLSNLEIEIENI